MYLFFSLVTFILYIIIIVLPFTVCTVLRFLYSAAP
jgi:hypothetical protein